MASAAVAPATALGKVISSGLLAASIGFGAAGLGAAGLGLAGLGAAGTGAALGDTGTTQLAMASAPVGTGFLMPGGPALTQIDLPSTGSTIPPTGAGPGATVPAGVAPLDDTAPVPLDEPASTLTLLAGIATTLLFRRRRATGLARR